MKKLFLHIGTEKTGTTSIQEFLTDNVDELAKQGVHVLQCGGRGNQRMVAAYCMDLDYYDDFFLEHQINTEEKRAAFRGEFREKFTKELSSLPENIHSVIISSEHFHSRLRTPGAIERLRALIEAFFSEVEIICYLREQSELISSLYTTNVKSGNNVSFDRFVKGSLDSSHYFDYSKVLDMWQSVFAAAHYNVRLFDKGEFYNGCLIADFTCALKLNIVLRQRSATKVANPSMLNAGLTIGRAINALQPKYNENGYVNKARLTMFEELSKAFSGRENNITLENYTKIVEHFSVSNQKVAKKFFGKDTLFPWRPLPVSANPINDNHVEALTKALSVLDAGNHVSASNAKVIAESAILLEKIDLGKAYKLMMVANEICPEDQLIWHKIKDYRVALKLD